MRVAIIGAGGIAREHKRAYASLDGVELVGAADPSEAARTCVESDWGVAAFATVEELLDGAKPEAVSICSPPKYHPDAAIACLERGVAVLCEKPLAMNGEEAERIAASARATGTPLGVAFCHRFHPPVMMVKEAIAAGRIGRVMMFRNRFGGKQDMSGRWFADPDVAGGGALMDTAVHSVDLFRFLVGDPTWVTGASADLAGHYDLEDSGIITLGTATGAFGVIEASWSTPASANIIEVYGSDGAAVVDYSTGETKILGKGESAWESLTWSGPDRFEREVEAFIAAVRNKAPVPVTGEDGLAASRILDAAYRSAKGGIRVDM